MPKQTHAVFPLLCDLCPKKPHFSDVSHLLTHISSKSHLSNRFKLQIRSQGEPEARRLLADFDHWYTSNGLGDLLSERLNAKDKKKGIKRTKLQTAQAQSDVKAEIKADSPLEQTLAATPIYRPPIPRMHSWPTDPFVADSTAPPAGSPWIFNSIYETPTMKRNIPNFVGLESPTPTSTKLAPTPLKSDDTDREAEKDSSKLKGIYWPGMNLFDSATVEMRRMRNQKKDGSALQQMKISSAQVEAAEWVFNADGGFRRIRDIFDESAESSPAGSVVVPTPKKRRTRKKPLADASINPPQLKSTGTGLQPRKRASTKRKLVTVNMEEGAPKKKACLPHLSLSTDIRYSPSAEEYEEFRRTMGDLARNRSLEVFRDPVDSPVRTESPLEDHRFEFSPSGTHLPSKSGNTVQNSPTPVFKSIPMRFGGKENMLPRQMDRHHMTTGVIGFNPDIFHTDSLNPLYTHSHAHARAFSISHRQLLQSDIKPSYNSYRGGDFKPQMMADPFSSMHEPHGLLNVSGSDLPDNIRYGM